MGDIEYTEETAGQCAGKEQCINKLLFKREIGSLKNRVETLNLDTSEVKTEVKNLVKLREYDSENISKIFDAIEDFKIFKAEKTLTNGQMKEEINGLKAARKEEQEKEEAQAKEKKDSKRKFKERVFDILLGAFVTSVFMLIVKVVEFLTPL
jgi:hypothetical protein